MSVLSAVTKGKIQMPHLILLYGPDGVGKSTFAANAPSPLFLGPESGTATLDVARLPAESLAGVMGAIEALRTEQHDYQTLVLDSLDWCEPLVWSHVCAANNWETIETPGYGKGYAVALSQWQKLIAELKELRAAKGMHIILIAHSQIRTFQDPQTNVGYDRYQLKLNEKAASLFREFVDSVLFANFEVFAKADKNGAKGKAYGDGARLIFTERRPSFDAKNRFNLPFQLPLSWDEYERAIQSDAQPTAEQLISDIKGMIGNLPSEKVRLNVQEKLKEFSGDVRKLLVLKNKVIAATAAA